MRIEPMPDRPGQIIKMMKDAKWGRYIGREYIWTDRQRESYEYIEDCLNRGTKLEIGSNIQYLYHYLNQVLKPLCFPNPDVDKIAIRLKRIITFYDHPNITKLANFWLGDLYYFNQGYGKAFEIYYRILKPGGIWNFLSSRVLSLKIHRKVRISAVELLTYSNILTKFGKENIEKTVEYAQVIVDRDYERGNAILNKLEPPIKSSFYREASLFSGCHYGYQIRKNYNSQPYAQKDILLEKLPGLESYARDISRRAENALREDIGLPRVGEGWIAETRLYYEIKERLNNLEVIQHFNDKWLGKQHLDIYIPSLKIGIEYHGEQHFNPIEHFGGQGAFDETRKRDNAKKQKCIKEGVRLLIIQEGYDIANILTEITRLGHLPR